jgi:uncharacterized protein YdbL (DUF1318 family)
LAFSATYDIKEMTPEIKAALDNRRDRFEQLRAYKEKGVIGENNRGYVELLTDDPEAKSLVEAENKDRRLIYKTILQQNNLADSELGKVEAAFAQVQKEKANPGDKIEDADGNWMTK